MAALLYRYEVKGIQGYVLNTNRLVEIAGGSALIESLSECRRELERALGIRAPEVYAEAAGSATLEFVDRGDLEAFARWWPVVVSRQTPGLQLVQAWAEQTPGRGDALKEVLRKLRDVRNHMDARIPEAGPLIARASRTGLPAVRALRKGKGLVDAGTARREEGKKLQGFEYLLDDTPWSKAIFLCDHHDFGVLDVAVIHIDGNDMGSAVMGLESPAAYRDFSRALTEATRRATVEAIQTVLRQVDGPMGASTLTTTDSPNPTGRAPRAGYRVRDKKGQRILPMRPVVVGGDDVTVITRACDAMIFVEAYVRAFHQATIEREEALASPGGMTASAGVVFVKIKSPFAAAYELAEALCGYSKRQLRGAISTGEDCRRTPSAVTFHRVTQGIHTPWETLLSRELATNRQEGSGGGNTSIIKGGLTLAPYLVDIELEGQPELRALGALMRALGRVPRGTVREWARVAQHDRSRSDTRWARLMEVLRDKDDREALDRSLKALCGKGSPWRAQRVQSVDGGDRTPVYDAITLRALGVVIDTRERRNERQ